MAGDKTFNPKDIESHNTKESAWIIVDGRSAGGSLVRFIGRKLD